MNKKAKLLLRPVASRTDSSPPKQVPPNDPIDIEDGENNASLEDDSSAPKGGKKRSKAWEHFQEYFVDQEVMVNGEMTKIRKRRALCTHCKKANYAAEPGPNGTTQMNKHYQLKCPVLHGKDKSQTVLAGDNSVNNKLVFRGFNQTDVTVVLIEMIVIDEMPFINVEKPGFRKFCSIAVPEFRIPSRRAFVRQFLMMYSAEKKRLQMELSRHMLSLTTGIWTSLQNMSYMVITAHFIDNDWKMHKRIISFSQIPNHQGVTIGMLIENSLLEWGLDKILAVTVDNASANTSTLQYLKPAMNAWENSKAILGGRFLHMRCIAHILNLIVGDGLKVLNRSVLAIRNAVAFVRSSTHRLTTFKAVVASQKIPCKGLVVLDVATRWNSTYLMLQAALRFRKAFDRLGLDDDSYKSYFKEPSQPEDDPENFNDHLVEKELGMDVSVGCIQPSRVRKRVGPPVDMDWQKAQAYVAFLKLFYEITLRVSSSLKPTIHGAFHDILAIEKQLSELYTPPPAIDPTKPRSELQVVLSKMSDKMIAKYDRYFGNHKDENELVLIGLTLDPRFKMKYLEHVFESDGRSEVDVRTRISVLISLLKKLYDCYKPPELVEQSSSQSNEPNISISRVSKFTSNYSGLTVFSSWTKKGGSTHASPKHEVDKYLNEEVEDFFEGVDFDILSWWKINCQKYPILAAVARDVLAVQVSTVASESAFSTGGRIIDCTRSSLTPKSVEALICYQNWLKGDDIISLKEDEPDIHTVEFYESCESEVSSAGSNVSST